MPVLIKIDGRAIKEAIDFVRFLWEIGNSAGSSSQGAPVNQEIQVYNPYEVLGISRRATDAEVKGRYRQLSKVWHPDVRGGDEEAMKRLNVAYQEICDRRLIKP
jgi:DnaJ-class molecular chaperone